MAAFDTVPSLRPTAITNWRVPTKGELDVLFVNRVAIGGFDESGSLPTGWYWSSSQLNDIDAWICRIVGGNDEG